MISGIEGDISQGKTLCMTYWGVREFIELKKPVFCNYELKGLPRIDSGHETPREKYELLVRLQLGDGFEIPTESVLDAPLVRELNKLLISKGKPLHGWCFITFEDAMYLAQMNYPFKRACLLIDEAQNWFDSRKSMSKLSIAFSYFVAQTGKQGINLYYTTQFFHQVDRRLRDNTVISIHVERKGDLHTAYVSDRAKDRKAKALIYGPEVWPFYNTHEVVKARA